MSMKRCSCSCLVSIAKCFSRLSRLAVSIHIQMHMRVGEFCMLVLLGVALELLAFVRLLLVFLPSSSLLSSPFVLMLHADFIGREMLLTKSQVIFQYGRTFTFDRCPGTYKQTVRCFLSCVFILSPCLSGFVFPLRTFCTSSAPLSVFLVTSYNVMFAIASPVSHHTNTSPSMIVFPVFVETRRD